MGCRTCCCCSPRAGARLVGILDLIVGLAGIGLVGYLLVDGQSETSNEVNPIVAADDYPDDPEKWGRFWLVAVALIFPSVLNIFVGMTILIAISMNNIFVGRLAYILNILLVLGSILIYVICFVLGYHWLIMSPLLLWALLQIIFTCAVQDFVKLELSIESV